MNKKNIFIFVLILLVGMTAVSAADIADDDTTTAATIETPQVEQTNTEPIAQQEVQEIQKEKTLKEDSNEELPVPRVIDSDLTIDDDNFADFNNVNWTVNGQVTVNGAGYQFTNVAINVVGDYVTLNNLKITTNNDTKLIDATGVKNLTITNSILNLRNEGTSSNNQAIGIDLTNTENITISSTTLQVEAPSQTQQWYNTTPEDWYSVLEVSAILINNADNVTINQNTIRIINTTEKVVNSTMPAITIKNGTENINVTFNDIYATGAHFVYGVMMNDGVTNAAIKNNTVTCVGPLYVAGIDASTATDSVVSGNLINPQSTGQATYNPDNSEESLAYGIISNTYITGNQNNRICKNTINPQANVIYAIEVYRGNNITVCSNHINEWYNAVKSIGVAFAFTNNSKIINNFIRVDGTTGTTHSFYEEIAPVNTGVILTNQSNNNLIQGNDIRVTAMGDAAARSVNITNDTGNTVTDNRLEYQVNEGISVGSETALVESGNTISNSVTPVLYPCDCGCMSTENQNMGITEFKRISVKKSLKKDLPDNLPDDVTIIDDSNISTYAMVMDWNPVISFYSANAIRNKKIIFNISMDKNISFTGLSSANCTILGDYSNVSRTITIGGANIDNFYGPKVTLLQVYNLTNSVIGSVANFYGRNNIAENNTIINNNLGTSLAINSYDVNTKNNYIVRINGNTVQFSKGLRINGDNNTPTYDDGYALNNSNYDTYFDETNTLKSEYADSVLFATETITKPVIINSKVTLSALRDVGGFYSVTFIEGSDYSLVEDATINKLTLNGVNKVNVNHNTLLADDSSIELIGSTDCNITNNIINTKLTNTITLDDDSFNNIIENNELYASSYKGDKSVSADRESNTVQSNIPIPVPVLKVNTCEFTVGSTATISASITLDDEVATTINKGKVVFKVNGKTLKDADNKVIYAKVVDGTATIENFEIPQSWSKNGTTITATYSGSTQCEKLTSDATEITTTSTEPIISTEDITTTANSQITLTATINDGNKPINTGKVVFKINGKTVKDENGKVIYATVTNGIASIPNYTLPETFKTGTYTITATFTAPNYEKLQTNSTLTVTS